MYRAAIAEQKWRGKNSGLHAWDVITPNRASSNIGEFAILLPGEEDVVLTKEMFVLRTPVEDSAWTPFYLLWALCLRCVRRQWQRITLMQTNREDVADRYREIRVPCPPSKEWAEQMSQPFRDYFTKLAEGRTTFLTQIRASGIRYIANVAPEEFKADVEVLADVDGAEPAVEACADAGQTTEPPVEVEPAPLVTEHKMDLSQPPNEPA